MSKVNIISRRSVKSILNERNILKKLHHPFIINMICSFQDKENLYLVMDFIPGGDLRYHLTLLKTKYNEDQIKFFICCLLISLEYIHKNKIIHKDIKPENILFDDNGYLHITDFGIAKIYIENNQNETSGTPGYMAPEVLCNKNHTYVVDFFALGVILYELIFKIRPYHGKSKKNVKEDIMSHEINIVPSDLPHKFNISVIEVINGLLNRKAEKRLGYNGVNEIKNMKWFKDVKWKDIEDMKMIPSFLPKLGDNFDKKFVEGNDNNNKNILSLDKYKNILNNKNNEKLFEGYTCINISFASLENINDNQKNIMNKSKFKKVKFLKYNNNKSKMKIINNDIIKNKNLDNNNNIFKNSKINFNFTLKKNSSSSNILTKYNYKNYLFYNKKNSKLYKSINNDTNILKKSYFDLDKNKLPLINLYKRKRNNSLNYNKNSSDKLKNDFIKKFKFIACKNINKSYNSCSINLNHEKSNFF